MPVPAGPAPDPSGSAGGKERGWVSEVYVRNPPPLGPLGGWGNWALCQVHSALASGRQSCGKEGGLQAG